jgi:hypothetical protein
MIGSLLKAEEVYYFFLEKKVTKIQDSKNASFAARGLCPANRTEPQGRTLMPRFAPTSQRFSIKLMPFPTAQATLVLPAFTRKLFCCREN